MEIMLQALIYLCLQSSSKHLDTLLFNVGLTDVEHKHKRIIDLSTFTEEGIANAREELIKSIIARGGS